MTTWLAIGLALCGAVCFAFSAIHQHSAVLEHSGGSTDRSITLRSLGRLVRQPRWLSGMALAGAGAGLALVALSLAPLAVIQPVGVLSVPFAYLIQHALPGTTARHAPHPGRGELTAVLATMAGTGAFVWFVSGTARSVSPQSTPVISAAVGLGIAVAVLTLVARYGPYRWNAIAWTAGGAALYGLGTTMVKSIFLLGQTHPGLELLGQPTTWVAASVAAASFPLGVWMVQHAFLAGTPQVVVAGLTVVDPLVCVVLGFGLLGEGGASPVELVGMLIAGAAAMTAVLQLARAGSLAPPHTCATPTPPSAAPGRERELLTTGRHS